MTAAPCPDASSSVGKVDQFVGSELKAWRNVQAACLLAGHHASLIDDDLGKPMLVVSKWAMTRSFHAVADAQAWLAMVTGRETEARP